MHSLFVAADATALYNRTMPNNTAALKYFMFMLMILLCFAVI
jgi:hypothetical protein